MALTSAAALETRAAGTFANIRSIRMAAPGGRSGLTMRIGGGGSVMWRAMIARAVGPLKGGVPASIS